MKIVIGGTSAALIGITLHTMGYGIATPQYWIIIGLTCVIAYVS